MVGRDDIDEAGAERVRGAIAVAERRTSAELVVVVAESCDPYWHAACLWPAVLALVVPLPLLLLFPTLDSWGLYAIELAVVAVGLLLMMIEPIRLACVSRAVKTMRARRLAREQWLALGLANTEERTGVLLFVALGEHFAEILADQGIDRRVAPGTWDACLARLLEAARAGKLGDGLVATVHEIGQVLATHAPPRPGDKNELPDRLILL